jgi:hypothetical protein
MSGRPLSREQLIRRNVLFERRGQVGVHRAGEKGPELCIWGLGFRVLGFSDQGLGFRVWGRREARYQQHVVQWSDHSVALIDSWTFCHTNRCGLSHTHQCGLSQTQRCTVLSHTLVWLESDTLVWLESDCALSYTQWYTMRIPAWVQQEERHRVLLPAELDRHVLRQRVQSHLAGP